MVRVNGERIQVLEYPGARDAHGEATQISPDGTTRDWRDANGSGRSVVMDFEYMPRWYRAGWLSVFYIGMNSIGANSAVVSLLEYESGAPFAGRDKA
jgi:hypothetical protein